MTKNASAIPGLTGLRFFAALYVFFYHSGASAFRDMGAPTLLVTFLLNGYFGVSVFFILSGFILSHAHRESFNKGHNIYAFLLKRFARIYPVYVLSLLFMLPWALNELDIGSVGRVLLMTQSWTVSSSPLGYSWLMQAWTLSVELFFYLSFPVLVSLCRRQGVGSLIAICVVLSTMIVTFGTSTIRPAAEIWWAAYIPLPVVRLFEFSLGLSLHTLIHQLQKTRTLTVSPMLMLSILILIFFILSTCTNPSLVGAASVLTALFIGGVYTQSNFITRVLGWKYIVISGSASYAFYLLAAPARAFAGDFLPYGRFYALPITFALSLLVWFFYEEPARRLICRVGRAAFAVGPVPRRRAL